MNIHFQYLLKIYLLLEHNQLKIKLMINYVINKINMLNEVLNAYKHVVQMNRKLLNIQYVFERLTSRVPRIQGWYSDDGFQLKKFRLLVPNQTNISSLSSISHMRSSIPMLTSIIGIPILIQTYILLLILSMKLLLSECNRCSTNMRFFVSPISY
jgi:hypothetical protein